MDINNSITYVRDQKVNNLFKGNSKCDLIEGTTRTAGTADTAHKTCDSNNNSNGRKEVPSRQNATSFSVKPPRAESMHKIHQGINFYRNHGPHPKEYSDRHKLPTGGVSLSVDKTSQNHSYSKIQHKMPQKGILEHYQINKPIG